MPSNMFLAVVLRPSSILVLCEYRKKEAILREVGGVIRLRKRRNCRFQTKTDRFAKKFLLKLNFKVFPVKQEITLFSKGQFRYNQLSLREKIEASFERKNSKFVSVHARFFFFSFKLNLVSL